MRLLPRLRTLLGFYRELRGIRHELHRLADVAEGKLPAPIPLGPPEPDLDVSYVDEGAAGRAYQIEGRLRRTLGREPSPEEILTELGGGAWGIDQVVDPLGDGNPKGPRA
jgi:hypothetical protein